MKTLMLILAAVVSLAAADLHPIRQHAQPTKADLVGKDVRSARITSYEYSKYEHSILVYMGEGKASRAAMPAIRKLADSRPNVLIVYSGLVGPAKAHTLLHRGGGVDWYPRVHFVASWGMLPMVGGPSVLIVDRAGIVTDAYLAWSDDAAAAIAGLEGR